MFYTLDRRAVIDLVSSGNLEGLGGVSTSKPDQVDPVLTEMDIRGSCL